MILSELLKLHVTWLPSGACLKKLGPLTYAEEQGEVFLGRSTSQGREISDETSNIIDGEVRVIIDAAYATAKKALEDNIDKLHIMADALMKYETIDQVQIKDIVEGREPTAPEGWDDVPPPSDDNASNPSSKKSDDKPSSKKGSSEQYQQE